MNSSEYLKYLRDEKDILLEECKNKKDNFNEEELNKLIEIKNKLLKKFGVDFLIVKSGLGITLVTLSSDIFNIDSEYKALLNSLIVILGVLVGPVISFTHLIKAMDDYIGYNEYKKEISSYQKRLKR